jgi:hypothetical protein
MHQIDEADYFCSTQAGIVQDLICDFFLQLQMDPHTL